MLDGRKRPHPIYSNFAGVVSRESIRIAFTYAALNGLQVCAADVKSAYLQAPSSRKDYIVCGPEFGLEKKDGSAWFIVHCMVANLQAVIFEIISDPVCVILILFLVPLIRMYGCDQQRREYILLYTDDALCISAHAEETLRNDLGKYFQLKEKSIGPPTIYLGGHCRLVELETGVKC